MPFLGYVGAIDPGVRGCGVSLYHGGKVVRAEYIKNPAAFGCDARVASLMAEAADMWVKEHLYLHAGRMGVTLGRLVVEVPRVYPAANQKGDQNDLISVALVAGACAGGIAAEDVVTYYPREWKGTMDGDALIENYVKPGINPGEAKAVILPRAKGLAHNVWDSVGIGLHYLGRLVPRRAYHKE